MIKVKNLEVGRVSLPRMILAEKGFIKSTLGLAGTLSKDKEPGSGLPDQGEALSPTVVAAWGRLRSQVIASAHTSTQCQGWGGCTWPMEPGSRA